MWLVITREGIQPVHLADRPEVNQIFNPPPPPHPQDRTLRLALLFIAAWLSAGPFRIFYARWSTKRNRQLIKKYKDEEGIA